MAAIEIKPIEVPNVETPQLPVPTVGDLNVGGLLDSVKAVAAKQDAAAAAATEALQKNTQIQQDYVRTNDQLFEDTLKSYENLQKINSWGGVNPVTKFMGLFDERYNAATQQGKIETNTLKAKQAATRAQTQIEINNQLPALKAAEAAGEEKNLALREKVLEIGTKIIDIDQKGVELQMKRAELMLNLRKDQRDQIDFALKSMPLPVAKQQLKLAQQGKGDWVGAEGFLEDRIFKEEKAEAEFTQLRIAIAKGNLELIDAREKRAAETVPVADAQRLIAQADAAGKAAIVINGVPVSTHAMKDALAKNLLVDTSVRQATLAASGARLDDDYRTITSTAATLALSDPRAMREYKNVINLRGQYDPNVPDSHLQLRVGLEESKKRLDEIVKSVASTMPTPEAKAAMERYGQNGGVFDIPGASAVTNAMIGRVNATSKTKYADAWDVLSTAYAKKLNERDPQMPNFNSKSQTQRDSMLAYYMQKADKTSLAEVRDTILTDPAVRAQVHDQIEGTATIDIIGDSIHQLSLGPVVSPVFAQLAKTPSAWRDAQGNVSVKALTDFLENQSVIDGGKNDYNRMFIDTVAHRATTIDRQVDPAMTEKDKALEIAIFGDDAARSLNIDFLRNLRGAAAASRKEKQEQLAKDRAGIPQKEAAQAQMNPMLGDTTDIQGMVERATAAAANAPSATGTGKPAEVMKRLYTGR
jgi:hypothetical protein